MPSTAVSVDGSRIGYESFGGGPPMLLVHGTSATHIRWVPVRGVLAQHYTVHEMDRRDRGLSTDEADAYSLRREARTLRPSPRRSVATSTSSRIPSGRCARSRPHKSHPHFAGSHSMNHPDRRPA